MRYYVALFFLITSSTLVSQISTFTPSGCLTDLDRFYYYEETLTVEELEDFSLNDEIQIRLKDGLTSQIISFIQTKSTLNIASSREQGGNFTASSVFNSLSLILMQLFLILVIHFVKLRMNPKIVIKYMFT